MSATTTLFTGLRTPSSFSAHRANRDAPESMETYRIPQHRQPSAPPPTPVTATASRPPPLALSASSSAAPGPLTAPVHSRMAGQAAARGISIDVALRSAKGPGTGRRWPASPGRTPTSASFPRARGLTVAILNGDGELYAESAPVTPNATGLKATAPAVPTLELVSSPGLPTPASATPSAAAATPRLQEKILCRYYHTAGMTCTSSPCRFVHKVDVPPATAVTAALSAIPLLSSREETPDPTSGTFAAAQASALAHPALLQIEGGVQIAAGEPVSVQTETGAEVGFVYKMSGGGKGPAGKGRLKYRTVPCKDYAVGSCDYGDEYCSFIHDPTNLYDEEKHGKKEKEPALSPRTPRSARPRLPKKADASPPADALLTPALEYALPAPLANPPRRRLKAASEFPPVAEDWTAHENAVQLQVQTDIPPTLEEDYPHNIGYPWSPEWHGAGMWVTPSPVSEYSPYFSHTFKEGEYNAPYSPYQWGGEEHSPVPFPVLDEYAPFWAQGYGLGILRPPLSPDMAGKQYWRTRPCHFWIKSGGRECPQGDVCRFQHILPPSGRLPSPRYGPHAKSVPCKFYNTAEGCLRSDAACPFAHVRTVPEGQHLPKPTPFRTRPCRHFQAGRCAMGAACHFAHVDPSAAKGTRAPPATPVTPATPYIDVARRIAAARSAGIEERERERVYAASAPASASCARFPEWRGMTERALAAACEVLRAKASVEGSVESDGEGDDAELEIVTACSRPSTRSSRSV
ncbi:hypothetical protein CC85DRAFT_310320 [Cutaneotrichosporon oleaginosum]|uniref:C3H1-type domain-containing protein n=1 Tax=Cutaneotrichosporon oleaginosum TaxID=879819 RepID=A0A0J0XY38_9TREE|nr:uncharacterized protein CC85DRAFT_310320 [Cutaneotrichosporon oleaginosum]KLT45962.1 hypothetical protein CC85DRAFT_310320 [Cutaneotrichosporon oleaginosum]TXT06657.1 hypothetical protein COLE_05988 [Cutaneotrichosporon oleaginosum]